MKKSRLVVGIFLAVIVTFYFFGCSKDKSPVQPVAEELVGTWEALTETHYWGSISNPDSVEVITYDPDFSTQTWILESDYDYKVESTFFGEDFFDLEGTWATNGNQLTATVDFFGTTVSETWTYEVVGDNLTLTRASDPANEDEDWDWSVLVFEKQ